MPETSDLPYGGLPRRDHLAPFLEKITRRQVNRAVVLMGPRRVGKTVLIHHAILALIQEGTPPERILYLPLDSPILSGLSLHQLFERFRQWHQHENPEGLFLFFDEIQYLRNWEHHLKSLVDTFRNTRFIASGSAAAALRLKSQESGAGRFSDIFLPPLSFAEYLRFTAQARPGPEEGLSSEALQALNTAFVDYINFGGYPEAVFIEEIRRASHQYLRRDIIDKVLLRDLPSLYGISDIQELNRLFATLAYNSGHELSLEALAQESGVAKATLNRYMDYLEAAFLIRRLNRVDQNARRFQRDRTFKVYLTNPSMRAALFGPVDIEDPNMGMLAETAIISQCVHGDSTFGFLAYARWKEARKDREVDLVVLDPATQKPRLAFEIKWSDRWRNHPEEFDGLARFAHQHPALRTWGLTLTCRSMGGLQEAAGSRILILPAARLALDIGPFLTQPPPEHI